MIDVRLKTFLTLLEEKNYSNTAKKLYISQPAVTHHIKSLEKEYDINLFENSKTFSLTKKGKILYEYALNTIRQDEYLNNKLKKVDEEVIINVGITSGALSCYTENLGFLFNDNSNNYNIYTYESENIYSKLLNGELELGIIDSNYDSNLFASIPLCITKLILVVSTTGFFKNKDRVTRDNLKNHYLIMQDEKSEVSSLAKQTFKEKNIDISSNSILHTNNYQLMLQMIKKYDAIGFTYSDALLPYIKDGSFKTIELMNFSKLHTINLIYKKDTMFDNELASLIKKLKMERL